MDSAVDLNALVLTRLGETVEALRASGATDSEIRIAFGEVMSRHELM